MIIGLLLTALSLAVLFHLLPGAEVAWLVVLVCGLVIIALGIPPAWTGGLLRRGG